MKHNLELSLSIIEESDNKAGLEPDIYDLYKKTEDENIKYTMLRLLGATGEDMALDAIESALQSGNSPHQSAAIAALAKWKDDSQFPVLISFIKDTKDKNQRANALNQALTFLGGERERSSDELRGLWKSVTDLAQSQDDKKKMIAGLGRQAEPWAIELLKPYLSDDDDDISYGADLAIANVKSNISKKENADSNDNKDE